MWWLNALSLRTTSDTKRIRGRLLRLCRVLDSISCPKCQASMRGRFILRMKTKFMLSMSPSWYSKESLPPSMSEVSKEFPKILKSKLKKVHGLFSTLTRISSSQKLLTSRMMVFSSSLISAARKEQARLKFFWKIRPLDISSMFLKLTLKSSPK